MSVRVYRGKHREFGGPSQALRLVSWVNLLALLICSFLWLLLPEDRLDSLTVFILIFFFSTAMFHAIIWHGFSWTITFGIIAYGISFSALALNASSGILFSTVQYSYRLGNQFFAVPSILPLFWLAASYFAFTLARRMTFSNIFVVLIGSLLTTLTYFSLELLALGADFWQYNLNQVSGLSFQGVPLRALIVSFTVFFIILFMVSQLPRNDKLSSRPPFFAIFIFNLFVAIVTFVKFSNFSSSLWLMLFLGLISLAYTVTALRDR